jgi:hypothetical protein
MEIIAHGHVLDKPTEIIDPLWELLMRCWSFNPGDRPSVAMIAAELEVI